MKTKVGDTYGRLKVISFSHIYREPSGARRDKWNCICECGNVSTVIGKNLRTGHTKSCGCYCKEMTIKASSKHSMTGSPTYLSWAGMKQRCYDKNSKNYKRYGELGITVCERWLESFENFLEDMGERPEGMSLNRVNGAKMYSKENCKWDTYSVQAFDQKPKSNRVTPQCGVRPTKNGRFTASITCKNKTTHLGTFDSFEEAVEVRRQAEMKYFGFIKGSNHRHLKRDVDDEIGCDVDVEVLN